MIRLSLRIISFLKRKVFVDKHKRYFRKVLNATPENCELYENVLVFRYLCHQLDKAMKNKFDDKNVRGLKKYEKAKIIFIYLEETEWKNSPDIKWGKKIINLYELWKAGKPINILTNDKMNDRPSNNFKDILYYRRSIRFWKKTEISNEKIRKILEMGIMAPSSCNRQPYRFVVVKNINIPDKDNGTGNKILISKAPYIIYLAIDSRLNPEKYAPAIDAGMAAQNILLAIEFYGFGACPIYHCESYNQKRLRKFLGLSNHDYIYLAIPFGEPAESPIMPSRVQIEDITKFIETEADKIIPNM